MLLCLCDVFRALINSLRSLIVHKWSGPRSVSDYISSVGTLCPSCRLVVSSSQTCLVDDFPLINDNVWICHVANSGLIKFSQCFGPLRNIVIILISSCGCRSDTAKRQMECGLTTEIMMCMHVCIQVIIKVLSGSRFDPNSQHTSIQWSFR